MQRDFAIAGEARPVRARRWTTAVGQLAAAWLALFALTFDGWRAMVQQWWHIDTYNHIVLIPPIIAWLVWLKREELARIVPRGWWPGLCWTGAGLLLWLAGRIAAVNLVEQAGAVAALQGAVLALLGLRAGLVLAFPLFFMALLVPFGDEIIWPLQLVTAEIAVALTHASGVPAEVEGIYIDTPVGLFIVAEACSGVKFLIAMIALGALVAFSCLASWRRRALLLGACAVVPIVANGVRAWGTIFIAQSQGVAFAAGFDHIVYGWIFFAIVIALVLGIAWRWFEREPEDAGFTAAALADSSRVERWEARALAPLPVLATILLGATGFAVLARLV